MKIDRTYTPKRTRHSDVPPIAEARASAPKPSATVININLGASAPAPKPARDVATAAHKPAAIVTLPKPVADPAATPEGRERLRGALDTIAEIASVQRSNWRGADRLARSAPASVQALNAARWPRPGQR